MQHKSASISELKDTFFSLKLNKSLGHDEISFNVIKKCFNELYEPLKHKLNLSIKTRVFSDQLKIAGVSQVYKADDSSDTTNYRPISAFPCFSEILETIIYNHLFSYVSKKNLYNQKNSVFNLAIQSTIRFFNWQTKFMNFLKVICSL